MTKNPLSNIDYAMADQITVSNLKDTMNFLIKRNTILLNAKERSEKHDSIIRENLEMIGHFKKVLSHYGEHQE